MTLAAFTQLPAGDLVLASASSIRAKILHDAGLGYRCYPVAIDEESVRASASAEAVPVGDIAVMLAEMKAAAAVQRLALESDPSPAFVLGCDQGCFAKASACRADRPFATIILAKASA